MNFNIIWRGIYYHTLENCVVSMQDSENEIKSHIAQGNQNGYPGNRIFN